MTIHPVRAFTVVLATGLALGSVNAFAQASPLPPPTPPPPGTFPPDPTPTPAPTPPPPSHPSSGSRPPSSPPSHASPAPAPAPAAPAQTAVASESGSYVVPIRYVMRPLTLPLGVLRGDLALTYQHSNLWGAAVSAGYGISDDFELDATFLPLQLAPNFEYTNPMVSGTYRFLHGGAIEAGGFLGVTLYTHDTRLNGALTLTPGLPVLVRFGESARLDTGVFVPLTFGADRGTVLGAFAPLRFTFQLNDPLYLGVGTGLGVADFSHFGDTIYAPLNGFVGYAIAPGCSPLIDVRGTLGFPNLYTSGARGNTVTDNWQAILSGSIYLPVVSSRCGR